MWKQSPPSPTRTVVPSIARAVKFQIYCFKPGIPYKEAEFKIFGHLRGPARISGSPNLECEIASIVKIASVV